VLLREQRQVETSIENIMAAIERSVITNTTTKHLKELEVRQTAKSISSEARTR
jgi:activator of 2-hydroxyglutaryl-CoA dehydratase